MTDYFVRFVVMPPHINAVTLPNDDGTFDIYINSLLDETQKREALAHELKHIKKDHFYDDSKDIETVENEAINKRIFKYEKSKRAYRGSFF